MPNSDPAAPLDPAPITPDMMARILEPRVRSNAKNNTKIAKPSASKILKSEAPADEAPESILTPEIAVQMESPSEISAISPRLDEIRELVLALQESHATRDRAFDLLYEELGGYKNDFYLERLKPALRALLFLLDSIEGFERELSDYDGRSDAVLIKLVQANLIHFRDQLTDVLALCELAPIEPDGDQFDPKTQRAVEVVKVEAAQNNTVQRQIRGGWRLGGKMLRAADVVVGRSK